MSWTQAVDAGAGRSLRDLVAVSATELWYHVNNLTETYSWNGAASTLVNNVYGMTTGADPTTFGGTVYIMNTTGSPWEYRIYEYDGTPLNWTLVDGPIIDTTSFYAGQSLAKHGSGQLLASYGKVNSPSIIYCRRTSDGSAWSTNNPSVDEVLGPLYYLTDGYVYLRCRSGSAEYFYRRTSGGVWSQSGATDLTSPVRFPIYSIGDLWPTLFMELQSTQEVQYSDDGGTTWTGTGFFTTGTGQGLFSWAIGSNPVTFIAANEELWQWNNATKTFSYIDDLPTSLDYAWGIVPWNGSLYCTVNNQYVYVNDSYIVPNNDAIIGTASGSNPTALSISPDDYFVYVGVLDGSNNPVLLQLLADLTANPIKAYEPGAGSAIGVQCADLHDTWVWIAGDFGGAVKVRVSLDDGATWTTKDPGGWSGVALPLVVGPDDDHLVLVPTDGDDDLFETMDGGLTWATLNDTLPFDVNGMDRLDVNLDEIMLGSDAGRDIRYTPNNGVTLHDLTDAAMANVRVSDLIIG